MTAFLAVVLAAGQGTRMKSAMPKVLHPLAGRPLISHVLFSALEAGATAAAVVISDQIAQFQPVVQNATLKPRVFIQADRLGTAHAVLAAREALAGVECPIIVLYGDTPLVTAQSLQLLTESLSGGAAMAVMGFKAGNPEGYGRLLRDAKTGDLIAIREEKDATPQERAVNECNSGIMAFRGDVLLTLLDKVGNDNAAREFYLTDTVEIARTLGHRVVCHMVDEDEVRGVNTRTQLAQAEMIMQNRLRKQGMDGGATLIAPETVTFAHDTVIGQDVLVEPNVFFGPGVIIENDVTIKGFSHIEGTHIGKGAVVGPFARLRPGTHVGPNARVGNFVEMKAAHLGEGAKVNHLSYIGDAEVGSGANIGAGTITCNYDGQNKHRTEIGANTFIGSNTALVAPVRVGDNATVGAGSVITKDVPSDALAVGRGRQINVGGWASRRKRADDDAK